MQGTNNCLAVCRKTSMPQFQSVSVRQGLEIVRKIVLAGHCCAIDQQGDDRNLSLECTREFDANVILRQIKFTVPFFVSCVKPAWSDDGEQNVTFCNLLVELLDKVEPRLHRVDIHKYILRREVLCQAIAKPPRHARSVVAPIVNEYACHEVSLTSIAGTLNECRTVTQTLGPRSRAAPQDAGGRHLKLSPGPPLSRLYF